MKKWLLIGILGVLTIAGVLFTMQQPVQAKDKEETEETGKEKKETIYNVEVAGAKSMKLNNFVGGTATLNAFRQVEIYSKTAGQVEKLRVEEGQKVTTGDVLIELDGDDARLELEEAQVNLGKAKAEYERIEKSHEQDLVSTEMFDTKKFEYDRARAAYNLAAHKVELTQIKAPFNGTITLREVELGQTVQPSQILFKLAALDPLEAEVFLPENRTAGLEIGQTVELSREEYFEEAFEGEVLRISPIVDQQTGTIKVTVSINNAPSYVRPGSYVHLRILTETKLADSVVPKKALMWDNYQNASVFVLDEPQKEDGVFSVKRVNVKIVMEERGYVSLSGLENDDQVIITGKETLKKGSKVRVVESGNATASL